MRLFSFKERGQIMAKLHELQEKRRNIAAQMRQLNDEIGENFAKRLDKSGGFAYTEGS